MQYRSNIKIIIDKRKLDILFRLGCPDEKIIQVLKTGKFIKTGDSLIDETLETFADKKEFKNWGGNHNPKGINGCNKKKKTGQVDQQVDSQVGGQVVDIDKDIDIDIDNNILGAFNKWLRYKKERKEKYTKTGLNACAKKLVRLSGGNPDVAMQIVEESISNNWAGLFPLKINNQSKKPDVFYENLRKMKEMEEKEVQNVVSLPF